MELTFQLADEVVVVKIEGRSVLFNTSTTNFQQFLPIDYLKMPVSGILKEFPELEGMPPKEMRLEAISRFKENIKKLNNENEIKEYIIDELVGVGYTHRKTKQKGWR